jgi:putative ABC transport system permease protein
VTVVDDRPDIAAEPAPQASVERSWSPTASWRFAARLARREVRRRPGRTVLVALLVAVPILAMTVGSILVRSNTDAARLARSYGTADLVVTQWSSFDIDGTPTELLDVPAAFADVVPEATTSTEILNVWTYVTTLDARQVTVAAMGYDTTSPITDGIVDVSSGRLPVAGDEVLLHPDVADDLGVTVGGTLRLSRPDRPLDVVGIGRRIADHNVPLMLFGELDRTEVRGPMTETLVDLPDGTDADAVVDRALRSEALADVRAEGLSVQTRDQGYWYGGPNGRFDPTTEQLAWGWVIGVLALTAAGIIIATAFATSARRQLATVGQLAANGASPRLVRRSLALQGTWSGVAGSAFGVVVGVGGFLLARPLVEMAAGRSWTNTVVRPTDLIIVFITGVLAATVAALLPARSLAGTSVLSALAGRRPIRPVNPRSVAVGAGFFISGIFLLAVATVGGRTDNSGDNLFVLVAILGGLGVLAGVCLASPLAITAATGVSSRLGASWRLSGRSLYRTRWRSAAVVTAIAVAGAFAVAAATLATGFDDPYVYETTDTARNEALLRTDDGTSAGSIPPGVLADVREVMSPSSESMVDGIDLPAPSDEQMQAAWEEADRRAAVGGSAMTAPLLTGVEVTVVDDDFVDAMGLSSTDRANLERVGALSLITWGEVIDGPSTPAPARESTITLLGADRNVDIAVVDLQEGLRNRNGATAVIMTEAGARAAGLDVVPVGVRFTSDDDVTAEQRRALDDIRFGGASYPDAWILDGESASFETNQFGRVGFWITYQWVSSPTSATLIQAGIVAATLLLVLVVVAIGLSLAAAESRDERNTLIAVGASPATLRRRSATTATLLAVTGGVVAVPTGLIPLWVVLRVQDANSRGATDEFTVPWLSIVAIVVLIPIIVGVVALVGSTIIQRLRPPQVMQAFTD